MAVITSTGKNLNDLSKIKITGGNEQNYFRIDGGKGFAILRLNRSLTNINDHFTLIFQANDNILPNRTSTETLKVTNINNYM